MAMLNNQRVAISFWYVGQQKNGDFSHDSWGYNNDLTQWFNLPDRDVTSKNHGILSDIFGRL